MDKGGPSRLGSISSSELNVDIHVMVFRRGSPWTSTIWIALVGFSETHECDEGITSESGGFVVFLGLGRPFATHGVVFLEGTRNLSIRL